MPSLRKRVSSYFRQLSFINEPRKHNVNENSFITKYLQGTITLQQGPPVLYGKNPTDLPNYDLDSYDSGPETIVGCYSGPSGGLTTVKRTEKHLSIPDVDIDFIDTPEEAVPVLKKSPKRKSELPLDNSTMIIQVGGQEYCVTNRKKHNKSYSLGSLSDFKIEIGKTKIDPEISNDDAKRKSMEPKVEAKIDGTSQNLNSYGLSKSKSEGNPFQHKRGKLKRLAQRPNANEIPTASTDTADDANLPPEWNRKSDLFFGLSDSLYDRNQITKQKNGDPIADCFGLIARNDSAILALADGVNWGEKACIAAKSAVHGCMHYLSKTIFDDTKPFEKLTIKTDQAENVPRENQIGNTREVFVCLLRAFNCAHDLILENQGMLTTLTVAVVLPLKRGGRHENYVCCVCNVGDTLAYVYSQKYGVRELTKGSHDINCNRDMRDALGALGPVDGINPELSNLTLSLTTLQKGDIVMVASDGLTDNFDPNVCKFTVNTSDVKPKRPSAVRQPSFKEPTEPPPKLDDDGLKSRSLPPQKPPRKSKNHAASASSEKTVSSITSTVSSNSSNVPSVSSNLKTEKSEVGDAHAQKGDSEFDNPLVAHFMRENSLNDSKKRPKSDRKRHTSSHVPDRTKPSQVHVHKTAVKNIPQPRSSVPTEAQKYNFLRSKTSIDMRTPMKAVLRNEDGIPFVTPVQRYELTLLLIEDILKRGISGHEAQCVTARKLCENLVSFTFSITSAKRRTLEDADLYFDSRNGVSVEVSSQEKKIRRRKGLERVQNLPGKLDHVSVVGYNVGLS